ncbi:DUF3348 family protein [Stenotrophomonas sp. CFBP 13724]|nr:DUF3348 family protein [Stenotrophomonas sp. CFBP 13724]MBD8643082.1 DUF3348 family protein [Stenotrophomonas sp. CFBP 13724]
MAKPSPRPPVAGPPLIRALQRLDHHSGTPDSPALPAALGGWVDWNRAVALARALDGSLPDLPEPPVDTDADRLVEECARARSAHAEAIHALVTALLQPMGPAELERRHAALQRAQLTSTGRLRGRLRDVLARTGEQGARLAEIDAVMEQVLAPREYRLLSRLPAHLAGCLPAIATADATSANPDATSPAVMPDSLPEPPWPPALRDTVRDLLLAELDLRFHPIDGLSAAVHPHRAPPHAA